MIYKIANNLKGFSSSSMRVRVLREEHGCAWVVTASLIDVGTTLVLDSSQLADETPADAIRHKSGLVTLSD